MKRIGFAPQMSIVGAVGLALPIPAAAGPISFGCENINGFSGSIVSSGAVSFGPEEFFAGEVIIATINGTGSGSVLFDFTSESPTPDPYAGGQLVLSTVARSSGPNSVSLATAAGFQNVTVTFSCAAGAGGAAQAAGQATAQSITQTTVNSIGGRVQSLFSPLGAPPFAPGGGVAPDGGGLPGGGPDGGATLGLGAAPIEGSGGQGSGDPIGVWGNIGYTGRSSSDNAARFGTDVLTALGGADIVFSNDTIIGGAVAFSWSETDTPDDAFERDEFSVTFAPYAAYAIDDVFSVDGSVGYTVGFSQTDRVAGGATVDGDGTNHSYFLSLNASGRKYWDQFGLLGSVGALWSQSFQGAYTESDGTPVGSARSDLGSLSARIQPSYLIPTDDVLIEPYVGLGYTYDYAITKITGAANDRGQMDVKAGVNLFGDGVMGGIEANTGLFRENERRMNVSGTLRMNF